MSSTDITIKLYESWMRSQIIDLTEKEYPFMRGWFEDRFKALYESDYQAGNNELIVAIQGENKVVACISYIKWPVNYNQQPLKAIQMVGLIVDQSMRGKGLFKKALSFLDERMKLTGADVVIGFPVETSRNGFLQQGWDELFKLKWYLKPVNITEILFRRKFENRLFDSGTFVPEQCDTYIQTAPDAAFWELRSKFMPLSPTYHKTYQSGNSRIQIIFRIHQKAGLNIAVMGKIYSGNADKKSIQEAIKLWVKDLKKNGGVALCAATLNEQCPAASVHAIKSKFYKTKKSISVILKSYNNNQVVNKAQNWNLLMADMETW